MKIKLSDPRKVEIKPEDRKYIRKEFGFSKERNEQVINEVMMETEMRARMKRKLLKDGIDERADAVASFLTSKFVDSSGPDPVLKYFGKRYLAYLRGEEIKEKLRLAMMPGLVKKPSILGPNGEILGKKVPHATQQEES